MRIRFRDIPAPAAAILPPLIFLALGMSSAFFHLFIRAVTRGHPLQAAAAMILSAIMTAATVILADTTLEIRRKP